MNTCQLHNTHRPAPLVIVKHHIQPLGMGGPDDASNWLYVCDTGHRNIHTLMGPLAHDGTVPTKGTASEREAAIYGYNKWVAAGKPGNPHAAYGILGVT